MLFSAYAVSGFLVAAVYAAGMLRGRVDTLHKRSLAMGMAMGTVAILIAGFFGDSSARFIYTAQPAKFAAMEGLFLTQRGAPIHLLGIPVESQQKVLFGIEIPRGLSILAAFDPNAQVRGLDAYPPADRPNPILVHLSFDTMVGLSLLVGLLGLVFWFLRWRGREVWRWRPLLWCMVAAGPAIVIAMEAGWFVTEFGRQPWVVYGILRTSDAATTAPALGVTFTVFLVIYVALAVTTARLLLLLAQRARERSSLAGASSPTSGATT